MRLFRSIDISNYVKKVISNEYIADELIKAAAAMGDKISAREASRQAFAEYFAKFEKDIVAELLTRMFGINLLEFVDIAFNDKQFSFSHKYNFMNKLPKDEVVMSILKKLHNSYLLVIYDKEEHVDGVFPFNTKREANASMSRYSCRSEVIHNNVLTAMVL